MSLTPDQSAFLSADCEAVLNYELERHYLQQIERKGGSAKMRLHIRRLQP